MISRPVAPGLVQTVYILWVYSCVCVQAASTSAAGTTTVSAARSRKFKGVPSTSRPLDLGHLRYPLSCRVVDFSATAVSLRSTTSASKE